MKVPDEQLRKLLAITTVNLVQGNKPLAVIDRAACRHLMQDEPFDRNQR
jgi:hypothetical protein